MTMRPPNLVGACAVEVSSEGRRGEADLVPRTDSEESAHGLPSGVKAVDGPAIDVVGRGVVTNDAAQVVNDCRVANGRVLGAVP